MTSRASWTRVTTTCAIWMRSAGIASGHAHEALLERSGNAFERVGQEPRDYPRDLPQVRPRQARLTLLGEPAQVFDDLRRAASRQPHSSRSPSFGMFLRGRVGARRWRSTSRVLAQQSYDLPVAEESAFIQAPAPEA